MNKKLMRSFCLEGKITQQHAKEIEDILTIAMRERDELLKEARILIKEYKEFKKYYLWLPRLQRLEHWLTRYKLLDKKE